MGSFGQTSLKWKISCKCTFKNHVPRSTQKFVYNGNTMTHILVTPWPTFSGRERQQR
jgi:hypothetical protein